MAQVEVAEVPLPIPPANDSGESIDKEIAQVREQIQLLTKRRRLISNTLITSTNVQNQLKHARIGNASGHSSQDLPADEDPLATSTTSSPDTLSTTDTRHLTNIYRLAFTVTTFPFTDPSPNGLATFHGRLLGIRFDHCSRLGTFQKPYYILLRRVEANGDEWRIHRHTIPAFVPLPNLEEIYLPLRSEAEQGASAQDASAESGTRKKQNLHGLVHKVRYELTTWNLRCEAIDLLKEELQLTPPFVSSTKPGREGTDAAEEHDSSYNHPKRHHNHDNGQEEDTVMLDDDHDDDDDDTPSLQPLYGISSLEPTSFEARQVRITWTDGTIARIKISNRGLVERAVVVGETGRIRGVENLLVDGESRIEHLVEKLRVLVGEAEDS